MDKTMLGRINALRQMSVGELRGEWLRLYGEPTRSRNKQFLFRRLAWRVQELQGGGLSNQALHRIDELSTDRFDRARTPEWDAPERPEMPTTRRRDPRLPVCPGTLISKHYKGRQLRVRVRDDGLELDGQMYASATALAKAVTGSRSINGWLFLGITKRKRS